jgi:hypothetical protein
MIPSKSNELVHHLIEIFHTISNLFEELPLRREVL